MRGLGAWALTVAILAAFAASGCAERDLSKPPKILYGRDACSRCGMIVQDERFAAAIVAPDGTVFKFDDIGCMQSYQKTKAAPGSRAWVHDFESALWLEAENAELVKSEDLVTPMGSGIAAYNKGRKSQ